LLYCPVVQLWQMLQWLRLFQWLPMWIELS
jgi:hypothetical protein